jgi:hypothetical protein
VLLKLYKMFIAPSSRIDLEKKGVRDPAGQRLNLGCEKCGMRS